MKSARGAATRREPKQQRARVTVDAVLEAVERVAKRHGAKAVTTNRIAEVAGVSVGSLYQYFPDKRAIFTALHDRHVDEVRRVMERTTADCAAAPLETFARELVDGLIDVHGEVAELHDTLSSAVPESASGFANALQHSFEQAVARAEPGRYTADEAQRMLFVLPRMVESLVHGTTAARLPQAAAKGEAIRTVLLYVHSCPRSISSVY